MVLLSMSAFRLGLNNILIAHYSIYVTRSLGYLCIHVPTNSLDFHHLLSPLTNRINQSINLIFGIIGMKRYSDSTLTFWNCWVFHRKGRKPSEVQVKNKPIATSLAGPNGNDMAKKRLVFPVFGKRDGENTAPCGFLPGLVRVDLLKETFDKTLDVLLGLDGGQFLGFMGN